MSRGCSRVDEGAALNRLVEGILNRLELRKKNGRGSFKWFSDKLSSPERRKN